MKFTMLSKGSLPPSEPIKLIIGPKRYPTKDCQIELLMDQIKHEDAQIALEAVIHNLTTVLAEASLLVPEFDREQFQFEIRRACYRVQKSVELLERKYEQKRPQENHQV